MLRLKQSLATAALAACVSAASAAGPAGIFIFGDSLSDSGNDALVIGANPGQVISDNSYIPDQPYASGQFSNGDVWAKAFTGALGFAAAGMPSLAGGGNFAFGGARVSTNGAGLPPSLSTQAEMFLDAMGSTAPGDFLYVVEGGGNDARDTLAAAAASADPGAVIAAAAAGYAQSVGDIVDRLQSAGARQFVVWDVPNLGLAPAVTTLGAGAAFLASQVALAMNSALSSRLSFEAGVSIFDAYGLFNAIAEDPAAHGLGNVSDACGAIAGCDPSTFLFWDGIHPTSAGHELLAQGMLGGRARAGDLGAAARRPAADQRAGPPQGKRSRSVDARRSIAVIERVHQAAQRAMLAASSDIGCACGTRPVGDGGLRTSGGGLRPLRMP